MKKLTIIIPVYNEAGTITKVLNKVAAVDTSPWIKEIIVIDDGSTDATARHVAALKKSQPGIKLLRHHTNQGKGTAVRTGIKKAAGEYILIQDADLEYDPKDIPLLLQPIKENRADVVYGTRLKRWPNFRRDERTPRFFLHYLGNRSLSFLTGILYKHSLTDLETGYKVFPKRALDGVELIAKGFEFEPEITIKLIKKGYTIHEVPIKTNPRGYDKGKKLRTIPDGLKALSTILRYLK
jgi:dolichol-phosphate mannosyltransferase